MKIKDIYKGSEIEIWEQEKDYYVHFLENGLTIRIDEKQALELIEGLEKIIE
jgi:hypothetical protein